MRYCVYDSIGRITLCGSCSEQSEAAVREANPNLLEIPEDVEYLDTTHYVKDGVLTAMPEKPSPSYVFDYTTKQWAENLDGVWSAVRYSRDRMLKETDWVVTKALESGASVAPEWVAYRQALRDITNQPDPLNIVWPPAPV
jgi:uncharacterized protein Usg